LVRLLEAEGVDLAARELRLPRRTIQEVVNGKLMIPARDFQRVADAYGVESMWLTYGLPRFWKPALATSCASKIRFLKVCIGGFPKEIGLDVVVAEMEKSEKLARRRMAVDGDFTSSLEAVMASETGADLTLRIKNDFPFDLEWLIWKEESE
jgi:hypothetical protein